MSVRTYLQAQPNQALEPSALARSSAPRLSAGRYTDGEERHRIGWHRGGCTAPCSSWRLPSSTAPAGFSIRTHSDVPISGVATKEKHMHVWLLRTSRLFGQVAALIGAAGHARAAARSRRTDRGIGHDSRVGVRSSVAPAFVRRTRRFRHRVRLDRRASSHRHRGRPSVIAAPLCGLFDTSGHARAFGPVRAHSSGRITPGCT